MPFSLLTPGICRRLRLSAQCPPVPETVEKSHEFDVDSELDAEMLSSLEITNDHFVKALEVRIEGTRGKG